MSLRHGARFVGPVALTLLLLATTGASDARAATLHVTTTGSGTACTSTAPCGSFAAAYDAAAAGDVVKVAAGTYGNQILSNLATKSTPGYVVFEPESSATVEIGVLAIENTDYVKVRNLRTSRWSLTYGSSHVILEGLDVLGEQSVYPAGHLGGASHVQILGGEIGDLDPADGLHLNHQTGQNEDVLVDGLYMHDLTMLNDPAAHQDCVQVGSADGLTIRNSTFVNCSTQGLFLNPYGSGSVSDVVVENNWIGRPQNGTYGLYVGAAQTLTARHNSITSATYVDPSAGAVTLTDNLLGGFDYSGGGYNCNVLAANADTFAGNMTDAPACAAGATPNPHLLDEFVDASTTDAEAFDLHLKPGAAAIDSGTGAAPATDFDGDARPQGSAPDIGADEFVKLHVAPGGSGTACTAIAPCGSLATAYAIASPGASIELAAGTYGSQTLSGALPFATPVLIRPAAGASVTVAGLTLDGVRHVDVQDLATGGWAIIGGASDVELRNVSATDGGGYVAGGQRLRIKGGEIGDVDAGDGLLIAPASAPNADITIDGLEIRDLDAGSKCVHAGSASHLTVRNSRFVNCGSEGVFLSPYGGGTVSDVTLENNWLGTAPAGDDILHVGEVAGVTIRHNSLATPLSVDAAATDVHVVGNLLGGYGYSSGGYACLLLAVATDEFAHNMTDATSCGGQSGISFSPDLLDEFVDADGTDSAAFDLHLLPGAQAIDAGDVAAAPATDIDGDTRPQKLGPDLGADELVEPVVYVSPTGSGSACSQLAPCGSFAAAYTAARPGWTVEIADGTYADQTLEGLAAKANAERIVFRPASGATVTIGKLSLRGLTHVEVQDIATAGWSVYDGAADVILRDLTATVSSGDGGYLSGASDVEVIGGEIGGLTSGDGIYVDETHGETSDVTLEHIEIRDLASDASCVRALSVDGLRIARSVLVRCGKHDVELQPYGAGASISDVVLENNWLAVPWDGFYSLATGTVTGLELRFNSFTSPVSVSGGAVLVGNLLGGYGFSSGAYQCLLLAAGAGSLAHNMIDAASCGSSGGITVNTNLLAEFAHADSSTSAAFDLHLANGAAAIGAGPSTGYPDTDLDGDDRPSGGAVDVGADERA